MGQSPGGGVTMDDRSVHLEGRLGGLASHLTSKLGRIGHI